MKGRDLLRLVGESGIPLLTGNATFGLRRGPSVVLPVACLALQEVHCKRNAQGSK